MSQALNSIGSNDGQGNLWMQILLEFFTVYSAKMNGNKKLWRIIHEISVILI